MTDFYILKQFDPSISSTEFKKITYNDIVKNKKYNNVINLITPAKEEIKIRPSLPIPVEDINEDEDEDEDEEKETLKK